MERGIDRVALLVGARLQLKNSLTQFPCSSARACVSCSALAPRNLALRSGQLGKGLSLRGVRILWRTRFGAFPYVAKVRAGCVGIGRSSLVPLAGIEPASSA